MRGAAALWALAALLLAEAGARGWPLWAGGLVPLACVLALAALAGARALPWTGGGPALTAARMAMLPLMATLPAMGGWCSAAGLSPAAMAALHVGAMTVPALLLRAPSAPACRVLLLAGGAALVLPGMQGLALAATLHAAAAGVACAGRARCDAPRGAAGTLAAAVLLTGVALDHLGPVAACVLHGALALAGLVRGCPRAPAGVSRARPGAV